MFTFSLFKTKRIYVQYGIGCTDIQAEGSWPTVNNVRLLSPAVITNSISYRYIMLKAKITKYSKFITFQLFYYLCSRCCLCQLCLYGDEPTVSLSGDFRDIALVAGNWPW